MNIDKKKLTEKILREKGKRVDSRYLTNIDVRFNKLNRKNTLPEFTNIITENGKTKINYYRSYFNIKYIFFLIFWRCVKLL